MKGDPPKTREEKKAEGKKKYMKTVRSINKVAGRVIDPKTKKNTKPQVKAKVLRYKSSKADSVKNPKNQPFVTEVAFNKGKSKDKVTQEEFNKRYGIKY